MLGFLIGLVLGFIAGILFTAAVVYLVFRHPGAVLRQMLRTPLGNKEAVSLLMALEELNSSKKDLKEEKE